MSASQKLKDTGNAIKEGAAFAAEELGEKMVRNNVAPETGAKMANKAREERNEAKIAQGELPKLTPVGSGH